MEIRNTNNIEESEKECKPCKVYGALEILLAAMPKNKKKKLIRKYIRCEATLEEIAKEAEVDEEVLNVIKQEVPIDKTCCELKVCKPIETEDKNANNSD